MSARGWTVGRFEVRRILPVVRRFPGESVTQHVVEVASFLAGAITVGRTWAYGSIDVDELIDTAEMIDGLPFARLSYVAAYKGAAGRPKDIEHLRLLQASGLLSD